MKRLILHIAAICAATAGLASAQSSDYVNFIRQVHLESGIQLDSDVDKSGSQASFFPVAYGGSRFELWTVKSSPLTNYLLDTKQVSTYTPAATVSIQSGDPYNQIPRTRADQGFTVSITVSGLLNDQTLQEAARKVHLRRHVQSYGVNGTGAGLDRNQATLLSQSEIDQNGDTTLTFAINEIPGADRTKIRGEERFSVFSLPDNEVQAGQLASQYIQVWPVATAQITGVDSGDVIKTRIPEITLGLTDLYPDSSTYMQVYEGQENLGTQGAVIPGSAIVINDNIPKNKTLSIESWDDLVETDGTYTIEVLTVTPFGIERLAWKTIEFDRTIEVRGAVISAE